MRCEELCHPRIRKDEIKNIIHGGGLSLGFQNAGFDVVAAFDKWKAALEVYRNNFNHISGELDLSDVKASVDEIIKYKPDIIIGGPPCQDFSSAGKRNEDNGRGNLTVDYAMIISAVRPEWFVMENVARITKTDKLAKAEAVFKDAGYGLSSKVLDASLCGVPQKRKRFFLIGKLGEQDDFILPFPETFKFTGSKTDMEQMIGNAVPVRLAQYVASSIVKYLSNPGFGRNMAIDFEQRTKNEETVRNEPYERSSDAVL